jgi:hypothetical protein
MGAEAGLSRGELRSKSHRNDIIPVRGHCGRKDHKPAWHTEPFHFMV